MLVIKRHLIQSSTYTYIAIAAASFILTFGILSVIKPDFSKNNSPSGSSQVAKESQDRSNDPTTLRKLTFTSDTSTTTSPATNTTFVGAIKQTPTANSAEGASITPSVANSDSTTETSTSAATTTAATPQPTVVVIEQSPTGTTQQAPVQQNPSLLGGLVNGLGGVLDAVL